MAKTKTVSRPLVIYSPPRRRFGRIRRAASRAAPHVRRFGRSAKRETGSIGLAVGGLLVGYADGKGYLDKLPKIGGSKVITLAAIGYVASRYSKTPLIRRAGVAALVAAAFDFGKVQAGGTSGFDLLGDGGGGPGSGQGY